VWQVVADMAPEEFVRCIDFRYILDTVTPEEAIAMLTESSLTKQKRIQEVKINRAVPAYSTQAGWLGFTDDRMTDLMRAMIQDGFDKFKLKVGGCLEDDERRLKLAREIIGYDKALMVDANQVWSVPEAVEWMLQLVEFKPE
jgi:L-galactonate dehydratase